MRQPSINNASTGCSCKAAHSSQRRTKSGIRRLYRSGPLHIAGLMFTQSILRNAAIPNYLIPMPFQKVIGVRSLWKPCDVLKEYNLD